MADDLDRAQQESDLVLSIQLQQRKPSPKATGHCLWCDEILAVQSAQFCSGGECQHDYDIYQRRNGAV